MQSAEEGLYSGGRAVYIISRGRAVDIYIYNQQRKGGIYNQIYNQQRKGSTYITSRGRAVYI